MNIGFLQVFNEIGWIKYSIDHAMAFCDKLIIIEGSQFSSFNNISERSNDGTLDIIYERMNHYSDRIELINTIRKFPNYRDNQAANFNLALKKCKIGDYFLPIDADEFYFDDYIKKLKEITEEGKIDYLIGTGPNMAFSFNWRLILNGIEYHRPDILVKKTKKLRFIPTHHPKKHGPNKIFDSSGDCFVHYKWIRPTERLYIRHQTSGFYPNMEEWFLNNWNIIELIENKKIKYYGGYFYLQKYDGPHPEILKEHPWRNINDIRNL